MPQGFLDAKFPVRGIDLSAEVSGQAPLTTPIGINVRTFDPSNDRGRGAARPGMAKLPAGLVPSGVGLIQNLNTVITTDSSNVPFGIEDPGAPTIDDPSSPGDVGLWGTGPLYIDPYTGDPVTGADLGSRVPALPGTRAKRRNKGSGYQPNPNQLSLAPPPSPLPRRCFQGTAEVRVSAPAFWEGTLLDFTGALCAPYVAGNPLYIGPTTALVMKKIGTDGDGADGTVMLDWIAYFLWNHIGHDGVCAVTIDTYSLPSVASCIGSGSGCGGAPPPTLGGTGVGAVIVAKPVGT